MPQEKVWRTSSRSEPKLRYRSNGESFVLLHLPHPQSFPALNTSVAAADNAAPARPPSPPFSVLFRRPLLKNPLARLAMPPPTAPPTMDACVSLIPDEAKSIPTSPPIAPPNAEDELLSSSCRPKQLLPNRHCLPCPSPTHQRMHRSLPQDQQALSLQARCQLAVRQSRGECATQPSRNATNLLFTKAIKTIRVKPGNRIPTPHMHRY